MRRIGLTGVLVIGALTLVAAVAVADKKMRILDACDPVSFNTRFGPGTCEDVGGDVTVPEFAFPGLVPEGHPGWAFQPAYIRITPGQSVRVTNKGGQVHTFTEVKAFAGGYIPVLNNPTNSTDIAPECGSAEGPNPDLVFLPSGGKLQVTGLEAGTHLFQCCIHPWMRGAIKAVDEED